MFHSFFSLELTYLKLLCELEFQSIQNFSLKRVDKEWERIYIGKCARKEATPAKRPEPR
jgi:hypothetical protein